MIHVNAQPEPADFDSQVRKKGLAHLQCKGIALSKPLPSNVEIAPYWRNCLDDLHRAYDGVCAYLAIYIERATGGSSTDHYIAKSNRADKAYEWNNYRLACSIMNSRKRDYDDVLDPFTVATGWFHLELVSGRIFPNQGLSVAQRLAVQTSIDRLELDDACNRETRARHYQWYVQREIDRNHLHRTSPFVYAEADRQGLL
jgi:hypothetical protein